MPGVGSQVGGQSAGRSAGRSSWVRAQVRVQARVGGVQVGVPVQVQIAGRGLYPRPSPYDSAVLLLPLSFLFLQILWMSPEGLPDLGGVAREEPSITDGIDKPGVKEAGMESTVCVEIGVRN